MSKNLLIVLLLIFNYLAAKCFELKRGLLEFVKIKPPSLFLYTQIGVVSFFAIFKLVSNFFL